MHEDGVRSLSRVVRSLEREARRTCGVPADVARMARLATMRALRDDAARGVVSESRSRHYYWAVVRRASGRSPAASDISGRFVLAAAAADLQVVEARPEVVWRQLQRDWRGRVPDHVLEEFGRRLCA